MPSLRACSGANALREGLGLIGTHEIDRASGPARAGELASQEPWACLGGLDEGVEGLGAVLEVVAAGGMGGGNEASEFHQVAGSQGNGTLANPLVLGEHVPGSLAADGIEPVPVFRQLLEADVAQRLDGIGPALVLEVGHDRLTLGAPAIVHPVGQAARRLRIANDDRRAGFTERQTGVLERLTIEIQRVMGTAKEAGELVEQARRHTHKRILRPPQNLGQFQPRRVGGVSPVVADRSARHKSRLEQKEGKCSLQARRAGETRSQGHVAGDGDVESRGQRRALCLLNRPDNSFDVVRPVSGFAAF